MNHIAQAIYFLLAFFLGTIALTLVHITVAGLPFWFALFISKVRGVTKYWSFIITPISLCFLLILWQSSYFSLWELSFFTAMVIMGGTLLLMSEKRGTVAKNMVRWPSIALITLTLLFAHDKSTGNLFDVHLKMTLIGYIGPILFSLFYGSVFAILERKIISLSKSTCQRYRYEPFLLAISLGVVIISVYFATREGANLDYPTISVLPKKRLKVVHRLACRDRSMSSVTLETALKDSEKEEVFLGRGDTIWLSLFTQDSVERVILLNSCTFYTPFDLKEKAIDSLEIRAVHRNKEIFRNVLYWPGSLPALRDTVISLPQERVEIFLYGNTRPDWEFHRSKDSLRISGEGIIRGVNYTGPFRWTATEVKGLFSKGDTIACDLELLWRISCNSSLVQMDSSLAVGSGMRGSIRYKFPFQFVY